MYFKREESSRAFLPVWSVHLHRRFTPYNVHTLIECDARRSASVRCARLVGCSSPSGGSTPLFYRFFGAFCMRVCPQGFGVCRARPCASSASRASPPPHKKACDFSVLRQLSRYAVPYVLGGIQLVPLSSVGGGFVWRLLRRDPPVAPHLPRSEV